MTVIQRLKEKLEQRLGHQVKTLSDCEAIARNINESLCNPENAEVSFSISRHSIARIFGISEHSPSTRPGTMDVIARYLDFDNAEQMYKEFGYEQEKSMFNPVDYLDSSSLNKGERIHISYEPDRDLILTYLGENRFIVNESVNSKLHKGDELHIGQLARGFEMLVSKVIRNGIDIGAYHSAKCGGLTALEIV